MELMSELAQARRCEQYSRESPPGYHSYTVTCVVLSCVQVSAVDSSLSLCFKASKRHLFPGKRHLLRGRRHART